VYTCTLNWTRRKPQETYASTALIFPDAVAVFEDGRAITIRDDSAINIGEQMKKEYDFSKGKRGPVVALPPGKTRVTIRVDDDLLNWFRAEVDRAGGGNYQTLINLALREFVSRKREPLENMLRRVIREELRRTG
jgi:uncharacterized protein (DUF4415 family)